MPEAVGGYFAVSTSHRSYGNLLASNASSAPRQTFVAAIDENPTPGKDASHPAFYLDGQELNADNLRGFWTLPPCQPDGTGCARATKVLHGLLPKGGQHVGMRRAAQGMLERVREVLHGRGIAA